jgi:ribulose-phosphate 3-epimerase
MNPGENTHINSKERDELFDALLSQPAFADTTGAPTIIAFDGPTAAGKTILANAFSKRLEEQGRSVWIYRLDWTLAARPQRAEDLKNFQVRNTSFPLEAELHMRLSIVREFLEKVAIFRDRLFEGGKLENDEIILNNLYDRENEGLLTGSDRITLTPGLVIILEGHYSLRSNLDELIDINIVLLANQKVLLQRKVDRVKGYRGAEEAEDYFWRIDVPSFKYHLMRFGANADFLIDNTDPANPQISDVTLIDQWINTSDTTSLLERVFSNSKMINEEKREKVSQILDMILDWDHRVGSYLRLSFDDIQASLLEATEEMIANLNEKFRKSPYSVRLRHTNTLYNVYFRRLPISIGLSLDDEENVDNIYIIADILAKTLSLQIVWEGGYYRFFVDRELGTINTENDRSFRDVTPDIQIKKPDAHPIRVIKPTEFMEPAFLKGFETEPVHSGREEENISASQILYELVDSGGVWIHRFVKFSELKFFKEILSLLGADTMQAGNYLIAVMADDPPLRKQFRKFARNWTQPLSMRDQINGDEAALDDILDLERRQLHEFITKNCPDFINLDGYFHCSDFQGSTTTDWERIKKQLETMLRSDIRLVRKRAIQFIKRQFPSFTLPVAKLWNPPPNSAMERIDLDSLTAISPTILAEVYQWMALRGENSAILGANIYDIRSESIDCQAYLSAASMANTPVVLQCSLNALGQPEEDEKGETVRGYLHAKAGAKDLVDAVMNAARDLALIEEQPLPLFGIGLDHVDVAGDRPAGRSKRFLWNSLATGLITHVVLDGSGKFKVEQRTPEAMEKSFKEVTDFSIDLLDRRQDTYIIDKEICSGEFNYIDDKKWAVVLTTDEVALFVRLYQKAVREAGIGAINTRPTLYAGNLGTTHHSQDSGLTRVVDAHEWRERIKSLNFPGIVLHGTTNSHQEVLSLAAGGCLKINVAGDFLHTLIKGLPQELTLMVQQREGEPKKQLIHVRDAMDQMSLPQKHRLLTSLRAHCLSLMDTISAPRMSPMDVDFFRYKSYNLSDIQIESIMDEVEQQKTRDHLVAERYTCRETGFQFSPSMIEVPYGDFYKEVIENLAQMDVRYFHVDAGDGNFVPRKFSGLEKARYLHQQVPKASIHAHLMIETPHLPSLSGVSSIQLYVEAGCNAIAIHRSAFSRHEDFLSALRQIRELGARPGIILETSQSVDEQLFQTIESMEIDWMVVMGVPVGYGGQVFVMSTLNKIAALHSFALTLKWPFLIEVDGGLNLELVELCRQVGAQVFAGWSIVKDDSVSGITNNIRQLQKFLDEKESAA